MGKRIRAIAIQAKRLGLRIKTKIMPVRSVPAPGIIAELEALELKKRRPFGLTDQEFKRQNLLLKELERRRKKGKRP